MKIGTEERKLAIEIIATLVHIKNTMSELILKPANVPPEVYQPLLYRREETTDRILSKRQIAPIILNAIENQSDCNQVVRRLIEIAAQWDRFYLADNEYQARATVQKARELLGNIELMEAREAKQRELVRNEELAQMERDRNETIRRESELLLMMLDELEINTEEQKRGYHLQDLLNRTFNLHKIPVVASFMRNKGGEQIDGAFKLEGWHYIVECRWRKDSVILENLMAYRVKLHVLAHKQWVCFFQSMAGRKMLYPY